MYSAPYLRVGKFVLSFLCAVAPIKIDAGIMVSCIKWNIDGKLLAFAGTHISAQVR